MLLASVSGQLNAIREIYRHCWSVKAGAAFHRPKENLWVESRPGVPKLFPSKDQNLIFFFDKLDITKRGDQNLNGIRQVHDFTHVMKLKEKIKNMVECIYFDSASLR